MITNLLGRHPRPRVTAARARHRFRTWRAERPFWAGLFTLAAGLPILYWPYANLDLGGIPLALSTTSGAAALIIGVLLITLGFTLWYQPHLRVFAGIATLLLTLISFPVANFGGLFLGLITGLIGGSLACSWTPVATEPSTAPTDRAATAVPPGETQRDT
ncbi:hypothetical protein SRB17_31020 [Streptomyces sp. RB17]|uniref:DUF6114 domain-containing protein n=1 Tax=Streptomyces sp. RB17 TaxID=2585197 RepID=UPI00130C9E59|nr:DUF6114 domain-containing protein [Streptomyces sp. RB17]MQY35130.1 hypothetical protein [Streptomyces sp. RB17]